MSTRLSVILPVYNGLPYLPDAVESISRQTYSDFTFIIVNDGSTDGSEKYLHSLKDSRIVLIDQVNQGQGAARNAALRRCQTKYVALMDQDDISLPDRFRCQVEYLDAHPEVVMVGTQFDFLIGNVLQKALKSPLSHDDIEARLLQGRAGVCNPSLMFHLQAANTCGGYPNGLLGEDIYLCLGMCEQGRVANLDEVLFQYRMHTAQTSLFKNREVIYSNHYAANRALCRRKGLPEPEMGEFLQNASLIERWRWAVEAWELTQYRTGRILIASGRPFEGFIRLAILVACRPFSAVRRATQSLAVLLAGRGRKKKIALS